MQNTNRLHTLVLMSLLTLSAYLLADTMDAMISRSLSAAPRFTSPAQQERAGIEPRRELADYASILDRGLFGDGRTPSAGPAATSSSTYILIGTVEGASFSGAVVQETTGPQQNFYHLNEKMPDGSQLVKVLHDRVTIRRSDGSTFDLQVVDDTKIVNVASKSPAMNGVRKMSDNKFMVDQREVTSSTENLNQLLTQARAVPFQEQGKTVGFRISEIVPGSLYEKIGLQNGDVIQRVNSQDVDDPGKFFQLYQGLKDEKSITLDLLRNGQRQTLNYDIQ